MEHWFDQLGYLISRKKVELIKIIKFGKFPWFKLWNYLNWIVKIAETIQNCSNLTFLLTDFASWDNCNIKIGNLANLIHKFCNN